MNVKNQLPKLKYFRSVCITVLIGVFIAQVQGASEIVEASTVIKYLELPFNKKDPIEHTSDSNILAFLGTVSLKETLAKKQFFTLLVIDEADAMAFSPDVGLLTTTSKDNTVTQKIVGTAIVPAPSLVVHRANRLQALNLANRPNLGLPYLGEYLRKAKLESVRQTNAGIGSMAKMILDWVIPAANAALPDPNQGPGGPILVITSGNPSLGHYYAEILRTEGLNEFTVTDISAVNAQTLSTYDVAILAQMPLTAGQVAILTSWVTNGGNLIAMRPDKQLAGLLGLAAGNSTLNNGYLQVNTSVSPGSGIYGQTIQFHGAADLYSLNSGTSSVATLYSNATTATTSPAVTLTSVGSAGGQASAFTYDLATSIVYSRQGNPAWAAQERDGFAPIRSDDKFFGQATGDPQVDWIDFNKIAIPQGDEQQRLLVNLILEMNKDKKPLPHFWYFPRSLKAVVIMTGDDHGNNGTEGRFNAFIAASRPGCSVQDWECVRGTSYMYATTPLTPTQAANFNAQGFEIGLHINTNCADFTSSSLETFYRDQINTWTTKYNSIPAPVTQRHHCLVWSDWLTAAKVQLNHSIRFDTSYYFWPPSWVLDRPGFFSGSGMPMRFSDLDGSIIDVYNATTQMTDESGQSYPFTINTLLDGALGSEGFYGAFTINAHTDLPSVVESVTTVAAAQARGIPVITGRQMMEWLDYRNSSSFSAVSWAGNTLIFTVNQGIGSANVPTNGLQVLLPMQAATGILANVSLNGTAIAFNQTIIKGIDYAMFTGGQGNYVATYGTVTTSPTVISTSTACGTWSTSTIPATPIVSDPNSIELGVKFRSKSNGFITGVRFYQGNTGTTFQASLWSLSGQQLATGSVTSTASGWQQVNFTTPVAISANTVYVASYHAPNGNYAVSNLGFSNCVDNHPIYLLKDGENGLNGLYKYSGGSTFPTDSYQSSNYWVDVVFRSNTGSAILPTVNSSSASIGLGAIPAVKIPNISITAIDPVAAESAVDPGKFMVNLNAPSKQNLQVKFEISGNAKMAKDYQRFPASLFIPAGKVSGTIEVLPKDDIKKERTEKVRLTLISEGIKGYKVRSPYLATVKILDND